MAPKLVKIEPDQFFNNLLNQTESDEFYKALLFEVQ